MCGRLPPDGIAMCQSVVFIDHREIGGVHRITSGHTTTTFPTSAFGGKADVNHSPFEGPLIAISGHSSLCAGALVENHYASIVGNRETHLGKLGLLDIGTPEAPEHTVA